MNIARPSLRRVTPRLLVTGGCGFIGCNLADALAARGEAVLVLDNLARPGTEENAAWLKNRHDDRVIIETADIRDEAAVRSLVSGATAVLHLAAQVAVTTSLADPALDFAVNAGGTLNVLESVRRYNPAAPVLFASTNKVYGRLLQDDAVARADERYVPTDERLAAGCSACAPPFCA
jgi:CDP-paratose 2-epimerase